MDYRYWPEADTSILNFRSGRLGRRYALILRETLNKSSFLPHFRECIIGHPNHKRPMTEMRFSDNEYTGKRKQTRREKFLAEMEQVLPCEALLAVIEPKYGNAGDGRRAYALETMLRIHLMHNWFGYSDPAMEEALYEVAPLRRFAGLSLAHGSVPDATRKLNF